MTRLAHPRLFLAFSAFRLSSRSRSSAPGSGWRSSGSTLIPLPMRHSSPGSNGGKRTPRTLGSAPPLSASGLAFDMKKGHARRCVPRRAPALFSLCLAPERPRKLVTRQELRERSQRGDSGYNETLDHLKVDFPGFRWITADVIAA